MTVLPDLIEFPTRELEYIKLDIITDPILMTESEIVMQKTDRQTKEIFLVRLQTYLSFLSEEFKECSEKIKEMRLKLK